MATATINRFIGLFREAFQALSAPVPMVEVERLAMLVHRSLDTPSRAYHTSNHVLPLCAEMRPRQVLAALFHDVVYCQLDGGFPSHAAALLGDVTRAEDGRLIVQDIPPDDTVLASCAAIFGVKAGYTLPPLRGMNEFLSAVLAARLLQPHLAVADLLAVVACIEATIPFRPPSAGEGTAADVLARRLFAESGARMPDMAEADRRAYVAAVVCEAVLLANRDVSGFADPDAGHFLASTWLLITEFNAPLAAVGVYSLREYRDALMNMALFLGSLNPAHIFQGYEGCPDADRLVQLSQAARRNIRFSCDYLDAKIAAIAVLEALALCTGEDCPVSMFLGDLRSTQGRPDRVEDHLPAAPPDPPDNPALLRVLESASDLTASPIAAFLYRRVGDEGVSQIIGYARTMLDGRLSPLDFLRALDLELVCAILQACARLAISRRDALLALERTLRAPG